MQIKSRVTPSGGSAVLDSWRQQHGPEAQRLQSAAARAGNWSSGGQARLQMLAGNGGRSLRGYMGASNDRLVADLQAMLGDLSGNAEVRMSLRTMRRRSRMLANDNEWVKRFLQLLRDNVVGARGFNLQSKIYKARRSKTGVVELDTVANDLIEDFYARQSKLGAFTACGKFNRATFERAAIHGLARDGEMLVEKIIGAQFVPYGLAWRMLDPDLLDDQLNMGANGVYPGLGRLGTGHDIRMGVERDQYSRPVAYWFHNVQPGDDVNTAGPLNRHRRVEADRVIHAFMADELRPDTARGIPWIYAAIRRMAMLGGYEEAALVNARTGASKMGFYVPPAADGGGGALSAAGGAEGLADGEDAQGNLITEAEPGTFGVLPAGWDFKEWNPAYPNDGMKGFVTSMLRAFSSSVGITYNTIGNDLEGVSLSAMRHGANQDRDTYEGIQQWFRDHVCTQMFEPALKLALGLGRVGNLPIDGFDRFNKPRFVARPFRSPDPQKDVAAGAQKVALGTTSRQRLCAEDGVEFEEVLEELAQEEAMAKAAGVTLSTASASATKNPAVDDQGPKNAGAGKAPADDDTTEEDPTDDTPAE